MTHALLYTTQSSPIGELLLTGDGRRLRGLHMQGGRTALKIDPRWQKSAVAFTDVVAQLREYFGGQRTSFDLELDMIGTDFQKRVWRGLQEIPYGETISYGELARWIGQPTASRAVGMANGRNPVAVIVPCHRVINADGKLGGFGGGLGRKQTLLKIEQDRLANGPVA